MLDKNDSISGKSRGLRKTVDWYKNHNTAIGATLAGNVGKTPHGLRHAFAQDELMKRGVPVSVKGAAGIPVDAPTLDRAGVKSARLAVAEAMGHSRTSVTGAYAGSLRTTPSQNSVANVDTAASKFSSAISDAEPDHDSASQALKGEPPPEK